MIKIVPIQSNTNNIAQQYVQQSELYTVKKASQKQLTSDYLTLAGLLSKADDIDIHYDPITKRACLPTSKGEYLVACDETTQELKRIGNLLGVGTENFQDSVAILKHTEPRDFYTIVDTLSVSNLYNDRIFN